MRRIEDDEYEPKRAAREDDDEPERERPRHHPHQSALSALSVLHHLPVGSSVSVGSLAGTDVHQSLLGFHRIVSAIESCDRGREVASHPVVTSVGPVEPKEAGEGASLLMLALGLEVLDVLGHRCHQPFRIIWRTELGVSTP